MAKKTPVKKSRRRLKRSIRRSLAAVLMITAIGVAAIPVPENYAQNEDGISPYADDYEYPELPYGYPENPSWTSVTNSKLEYTGSDADLTVAYIINALSDGTYQRDWQFKFFTSNEGGIIKEYNSKYQQDRVELKANIACDYAIVETDDFDKFFAEDTSSANIFTYTVKNPTIAAGGEDDTFFKEWFTDEYDSYCKGYAAAYADYQQRHQEWVEGPEDSRGEEPTEPVFTRTLAQIDLQKKYEYYCTYAEGGKYKGCRLAVVIDAEQLGDDGKNKRVYIPQELSEGSLASSLLMADDQGFVYRTDASIIGIGNRAFAETTNVKYLTVPKEIKYIGKSAFEDSFLKEIKLINVQDVCDKAFKNCSDLTSVEIGDGAQRLGAESFYGTGITELSFPSSVSEIGPGAFAECTFLQKIDFSSISGEFSVDDYAFYNTLALNSVNVMINETVTVRMVTLGHCAFAADGVATGALTDFMFPAALKSIADPYKKGDDSANSSGLGDYVLAGRTNMLRVIMPEGIGSGTALTIPDGTLYGCYNLEYIRFPDASSRARYNSARDKDGNATGLFQSVTNPKFFVWGPELDLSTRNPANPRTCTWTAVTVVRDTVPYRYDRGDQQFYEISDGTYLLCVDNNGVLTSCTRMDTTDNLEGKSIDLPIPATVGETVVTAIATNCFSDNVLNQHVRSVTIEDDSKIATINAGVFQGWGILKEVYIGNSVTSIGDNAFKDCTELNDVTFSSPLNGHESFTIGTDAFKTQSQKLTFHGDIVQGYAPFEWAMKPDNEIGADGLRICYKSLAPDYLTVMYNPITELVTLLDYPKFNEIETLLYDAHAKEITDLGYKSYVEWRVETIYEQYGLNNKDWNPTRQNFAAAWIAAQTDEDRNALYSSNSYGPWITPEFCAEWDKWTEKIPDDRASVEDDGNKLTDWLFEPIVAYAAEGSPDPGISSAPEPYFRRNEYIIAKADTNPYAAQEERDLIDATKNIVIPAGVQSIDVYGFVKNLTADGGEKTGSASNTKNANTYLWAPSGWDSKSWDMYEKTFPAQEGEDGIESVPGLFSGFYEDGSSARSETRKRGNDVITTVTMYTVEYLPKYAFDSCENLYSVTLGSELADIGKAPFRGCYSLQLVEDNDYYTTVNGIVYSYNSDGSLTIEECLAARGGVVGQAYISADSDPNIKSVSTIREGAFEDCDYITGVDFDRDNTAGLTVIPEDCFKNSGSLGTVVLPVTVNSVKSGAFVGANRLGSLTVYGREVDIDDNAFDTAKVEGKQWTTVQAYADSAVVRYVDRLGQKYGLRYDDAHPLGEYWSVSFYDANYELIEDLKDMDGDSLENPQYVKDGERPTTPQSPANTDDWTFERWVGMNNLKLGDPIHENSMFYAQGYTTSGLVGGKYPVTFLDGVDGSQVGPTQYIDPGSDAIPPAHPVHAGYDADGFSDDYTNIQSPKTILMKYKVSGTNGSGTGTGTGTGTGSSGTTQTSSGSTTNTSGSSSSTTSSSGSTSTTSTTSGSGTTTVGKYSVTVVNGSGSGTYDAGSTVVIAANTPPTGMVFQRWTTESNGVSFASVSMTATTFVMPANNVTVTANYVAGSGATASNGSGSTRAIGTSTTGNNGTRVDITKPGISNKDLATANVNGSTDNFVVKISETDEATRAVADALSIKYGNLENILYYAMDISLYDSTGTTKITDTTGLTVDITIPIPDALVAYGGNNMAGAVINGNQLENLNESFTTINGVPCIRFTATHFSPYTVYVDTGNLTEGMLDVTPKTGDPIHPKWFLSIGLACLSIILFMKKDKKVKVKTV